MKRFVMALLLPFLFLSEAGAGEVGIVHLLTGFSAKESCSCAFVVQQTDDYCMQFGQVEGFEVDVAIDHEAKMVTATFNETARTAHFTDAAGCVLDPL